MDPDLLEAPNKERNEARFPGPENREEFSAAISTNASFFMASPCPTQGVELFGEE
jgi:hypothetical protein